MTRFVAIFTFVISLFTAAIATAQDKTILVLDASNSMWGQIDGVAKITIAQEVIGDLLQNLPADQQLGLVAYGHRRAGDCTDIETLVSPGLDTRDAIATAVNSMSPRGKTPLSAAVLAAAEELRYEDVRATVILVSDGRETCDFDPCALGLELEKAGVDFTAHVVGFDVENDPEAKAQLQCLAENTGGRFLTADTADELTGAMEEVMAPAVPEPVSATFDVRIEDNGPMITDGVIWFLEGADGSTIFAGERSASIDAMLMPGDYTVTVLRPEDEADAALTFTVSDTAVADTLELPLLLPDATLDAADTAVAGSQVPVTWTGPDGQNDYISVTVDDPNVNRYTDYTYTREGSPLDLRMPALPGDYLIQYVLNETDAILATRPITVTDVTATLTAPETAAAGEELTVEWTGPDYQNDFITVAEIGEIGNRYINYTYAREGSPLQLTMPAEAGTYEIRYVMNQTHRILASQTIVVEEVSATLTAPDTAAAGESLVVEWTGPDYQNDYISVAEIGQDGNRYVNYTYTREGSPLRIDMPPEPGTYELRYIQNQDGKILASQPIVIEAVTASVTAPATAAAGEDLVVTWEGPDYQNDYLAVFEANAAFDARYLTYTYTREGSPLRLTMPTEPGEYEIRYIQNQGEVSLAATPITIEAVTATLTIPVESSVGQELVVQWTGPDYQNDYIAIFAGDAAFDDRYINYTYTRDGSPLRLTMPTEPGEYEIRYIQNQDEVTLASARITLKPITGSLTIPTNTDAGGSLVVEWEGPDYQNDYIAVYELGSDDARYINYTYTREGSPLRLDMPALPGAYEIRYVMNQNETILARQTITVDPVSATITAPETATIDEDIVVTWEGPDNTNDYIAVYPAGSPDDARYTAYTYTREGSPLRLRMPSEAGDYEIRYIMNQGATVLTGVPIKVE